MNRQLENPLEVLANPASSLLQITEAVTAMEGRPQRAGERALRIGISSNVTLELLGLFLRRHALLHQCRPTIVMGHHDDPVADMERFSRDGVDLAILWPLFDNLLPALEAQALHLSKGLLEEKESEFRSRYRLAMQSAAAVPRVLLAGLHRLHQSADSRGDAVDALLGRFDRALRDESSRFPNVQLLATEPVVRTIGQASAFDLRFYFSSKAPYTAAFLDEFARQVSVACRGFGAHFLKVLVVDADNTLWGGIVGDEGLSGIALGPFKSPGNIFWMVQNELLGLERHGVLLCLCSKNNPVDVEQVLASHPDRILRSEHFIAKRVNWEDKVENIRAIAEELNLGLDSFVFLDDSSLEIEAVRSQLPMVGTFQVPKRLSDYPRVIQAIKELFLAGADSSGSGSRTGQYRQVAVAREAEAHSATREEYLASLQIQIAIARNDRESISRISELTQKSNQFNLTTRRYTAGEISALMDDPSATVYSVQVRDRFGGSGLTGVTIVRWLEAEARIEAFLMSCRIIGRGIEFAVWDPVKRDAIRLGCDLLHGEYRPTRKNVQVVDFYDRLGLEQNQERPGLYTIRLTEWKIPDTGWIEIARC